MAIKFNLPKKDIKTSTSGVVSTGGYNKTGANNKHSYTGSSTSNTPLTKNAQMAGSGASVIWTQPMFFSPLHTPQNWQIASKRRECYQWDRFYYDNEPKVAAGVDFYSIFPMNGFTLECKNKKVLKYFEKISKRLRINYWLKLISHEYFLLGDVFPFLEISCPHCGGGGTLNTGEICNHSGGTIKRIVVLNPDWIEVQTNVLANEPVIALVPDDELKMIVQRKQPRQIYDKLPKKLIDLVASGMPISLSNRCVSHIKHNASPYGVYGTSMLRRLFTVLAYKTKLMTANWIVAERLILPVRVVKIGDKDRPASPEDIADVSGQLAAVANDPNLTLVTHHAFEYEWYGACYSSDTKTLCKSGWKNYWEVGPEDEIMIFDPKTNIMKYEKPLAFHEYDYDGFMVEFKGNKVNMSVTPNHTMLGYKRDLKTAYSMQAKDFANMGEADRYVRCVGDYSTDAECPENIDVAGYKVPIDDFLKFAGYYLSEGHSEFKPEKRRYIVSIAQSPTANPEYCDEIDTFMPNMGIEFSKYAYEGRATTWNFLQKDIAKQIGEWFGHTSYDKKIPEFIKNLPSEKLEILIEAFNNGDASSYNYKNTNSIQVGTTSRQLSLDFTEILFKAGYAPVLSEYKKEKQFIINCNMTKDGSGKGRMPRVKDSHINYTPYSGKVWCFETSTGFFVTMRNGRISVQGNSGKIHNINNELDFISKEILDGLMLNQALLNGEMAGYSSAQVGVEVMIRRLDSWRNELAEWVENHIFLPIAMMQGFIDEEESKSMGETVYLTPTIKWNDLNLRDTANIKQMYIALHDKKLISSQTLLDQFDIDYDQEIEKIREETVAVGAQGQMAGPGGGGSPLAGMPGGGGGGAPGGPPPGGEAPMGGPPGGDMSGVGGAPGAAPAGAGAGAAPAGGAPMGASAMAPGFKITKRGKGKNPAEAAQEQQPQIARISLTKLEQKMYKVLIGMGLPYKTYVQYKVEVAGQQQPFVIDFAVPEIGIGIETDGAKWHEEVEAKAKDQQRDQKLAGLGWRILRFKEAAIEERMNDVQNIIIQNIELAAKHRKKAAEQGIMIKEASIDFKNLDPSEIVFKKESMEGDLGDIFIIGA